MLPDSRKLIADALFAGRDIISFTRGLTLSDFVSDERTRAAVYWKFSIIGEALSHLRRVDEPTFTSITDGPKIVGFRNQIIHGYAVIDDAITWDILETKLPTLIAELEALLK